MSMILKRIDPRAEWTQIFNEAWRINRDYFYAPEYAWRELGRDERQYAALLPDLSSRGDLNRVIQWMCSELSVDITAAAAVTRSTNPGRCRVDCWALITQSRTGVTASRKSMAV
jgi:hypothetical protein